ncbi:hypothetical protein [Nannocystis pusilla]|uniref:hypothetical protein n=1 Tax=Nannocystis pusilla TaxID=889268 RepID=UPI003B7E724E
MVADFAAVPHHNDDHYYLVAHGGAYRNNTNDLVSYDNLVQGQATCIYTTRDRKAGSWKSGQNPVKIADLTSATELGYRRCYLNGVTGVNASWNSSSSYARPKVRHDRLGSPDDRLVRRRRAPRHRLRRLRPGRRDLHHLPLGTTFTSGAVSAGPGTTNSDTLTSGSDVNACWLTEIYGALNVNDVSDGAVMTFPGTPTGNWTLTVKNGKTAHWECAQ